MTNQELETKLRAHAAAHPHKWRHYTLYYQVYYATDPLQQDWYLIRDAATGEILPGVERGAASAFRRIEMLITEPMEMVAGCM
ncbi:MAG TPA: hypothetical protein VEX70_00965 [Pyrinomonadaceae bacterium]|nr:hypothetical protein [Pyrinomonadaceae bacterium]